MDQFQHGPIPYSKVMEGSKPGPNIAIVGGTHGNELVSLEVLKRLAEEIEIIAGKLLLIIGNPAAIAAEKRFINQDLNRSFSDEALQIAAATTTPNVEQSRALKISKLLKDERPDQLYDIHNTIRPSEPFVVCESTPAHLAMADKLGLAKTLYYNAPEYNDGIKSAIDTYADCLGGNGLTYETGCLEDGSPAAVVDTVVQEMKNVLAAAGMIAPHHAAPLPAPPKTHFETFELLIAKKNFKFATPSANGKVFKTGELIGYDGYTPIYAPEDCVTLFPKTEPIQPGSQICELARKKPAFYPFLEESRSCVSGWEN